MSSWYMPFWLFSYSLSIYQTILTCNHVGLQKSTRDNERNVNFLHKYPAILLIHIFIVTSEYLYRKLKSFNGIWLCETNMTLLLYKIFKCYYIPTLFYRKKILKVPIMCFPNKHFFFSFWAVLLCTQRFMQNHSIACVSLKLMNHLSQLPYSWSRRQVTPGANNFFLLESS
jgi:hypothetical protein